MGRIGWFRSIRVTALTYDGNGNTVSMPGRAMVWSAANRLVEVSVPSGLLLVMSSTRWVGR